MRRKRSMTQVYLASMLLLTIIPIVLIGCFWVAMRYQQFEVDVEKQRQTYLETNKQFLQDQVAEIISYIHYAKHLSEQRLRDRIRTRVEQANAQISALYTMRSPGTRREKNALLEELVAQLRPVRFSDGRGWYVLMNSQGTLLMSPMFPQAEGRNVNEFQDSIASTGMAEAVRIAREEGEGYIELQVNRAGNPGQLSTRLFYIKLFKPLDLLILSGEYAEDVDQALQAEVLTLISETRYYPQRSEPFIISGDGRLLARPSRAELIGKDISAHEDMISGEPLAAKAAQVAGDLGGGFYQFAERRDPAARISRGVNFVRAYPPWDWIIGSGFHLDKLESQISADREIMRAKVAREMGFVVLGLALAVAVVIAIASWFARKTAGGFREFSDFFEAASHGLTTIEKDRLPYAEFSQLAEAAHWMLEERSRYEVALKDSEQRFKLALKYSQNFMWDLDAKSGRLVLSEGFFESLGYAADEVDVNSFDTLIGLAHPDDVEALQSDLRVQKIYKSGIEFRLRQKSGQYRWFIARGSRVDLPDTLASRHRLLGIVTDITDRKNIERELIKARIDAEEASEAKSQFLATMSHELRTPLNGVMGYAQLLLRDTSLTEEQREYLAAIIECGEHLLELIGELLQLAQTESEEIEVVREPVELAGLIQSVADVCSARAERHQLEFLARLDRDVPTEIVCDAGKLKQILINMVTNGIKFTEQGWVRLDVEIDASQQYLNFIVSDSGVGIDPRDLAHIFEPFSQLHSDDTEGAGLGLALSYRLAASMHGELMARSEVGKGSTFTLRIPLQVMRADLVLGHTISYQSKKSLPQAKLESGVVRPDQVQQLRQALELGDVESLEVLIRKMLEQSTDTTLNRWLQGVLDSLEHFDIESVQQMIRKA